MGKEGGEMSSLNIAVVDSSEYFRNMIVRTLEREKFNVVGVAGTFDKMTEILSSHVANLFIVEIVMPDRSGLEVARFVSDKNWGILVIMMSFLEGDDFVVESIKSGIVDYLRKPFGAGELLKSVRRVQQRMGSA